MALVDWIGPGGVYGDQELGHEPVTPRGLIQEQPAAAPPSVTTFFVDDGGSNTSPFDTWAKAATTIQALFTNALLISGSTIYVGSDHYEEAPDEDVMILFPGILAGVGPITVISADNTLGGGEAGDITYEKATSPQFAQPDWVEVQLGGNVNWVGCSFTSAGWFENASVDSDLRPAILKFFDCDFVSTNTFTVVTDFWWQRPQSEALYFENCTFQVNNIDNGHHGWAGKFWYRGCSISAGGVAATNFLAGDNDYDQQPGSDWRFDCCDFTGLNATASYLVSANVLSGLPADEGESTVLASRCLFNANGEVFAAEPAQAYPAMETHNAWKAGSSVQVVHGSLLGRVEVSTANYRTGKHQSGVPYSLRSYSGAARQRWIQPHRFKLCEVWAEADATITVQLGWSDSIASIKTDEVWVEIAYPGVTTGAEGNIKRSRPDTILPISVTELDVSTETWSGGIPGGSGGRAEIAVAIAGSQAGLHTVWVCVAKASVSLFFDPHVDINYA